MIWETWQPEAAVRHTNSSSLCRSTSEINKMARFTAVGAIWCPAGGPRNSDASCAARTPSWWCWVISVVCPRDDVENTFIFSPYQIESSKRHFRTIRDIWHIAPLVPTVMCSVKTMELGDSLPPDLLGFYQFSFFKVNLRPEFTHSHTGWPNKKTSLDPWYLKINAKLWFQKKKKLSIEHQPLLCEIDNFVIIWGIFIFFFGSLQSLLLVIWSPKQIFFFFRTVLFKSPEPKAWGVCAALREDPGHWQVRSQHF